MGVGGERDTLMSRATIQKVIQRTLQCGLCNGSRVPPAGWSCPSSGPLMLCAYNPENDQTKVCNLQIFRGTTVMSDAQRRKQWDQ